jgi:hypothetical protein
MAHHQIGGQALTDQPLQQPGHRLGPQALGLEVGGPGVAERNATRGHWVVAVQPYPGNLPGRGTADGHHLMAPPYQGRRQMGVLAGKVLMDEQHLHPAYDTADATLQSKEAPWRAANPTRFRKNPLHS